jgi:2-aminoadipate transaminase
VDFWRLFPDGVQRALSFEPPGAWMPQITQDCIRLSAGYPSPTVVPSDELANAALKLVRAERDLPFHYLGSPRAQALPMWVRGRLLQRGMQVTEAEILITSGGCQAIDLAARVLLDEHSIVLVEAPTYMEALEIFRNYTDRIEAIPVDELGLCVDKLEEKLRDVKETYPSSLKMLYTIPSFQNPTGTTMSLERRVRLLELAEAYDFVIVEDDAYGELAFTDVPPTLKAMDGKGRVVHIGSLSKVVAPGLRVGWVVGPEPIIQAMNVYKKDLSHPFAEAVTTTYLREVDFTQRIQELRTFYQKQWQAMERALSIHMPDGVTWTTPQGGYFTWLTVDGVDTVQMLDTAIQHGVAYVPGKYFYSAEGHKRHHLRLSFSYLPHEQLELGVKRLAQVIQAQRK